MTQEQRNAILEVSSKSLARIQAETARTWAHRAWAARMLAAEAAAANDFVVAQRMSHASIEFSHEAIEHAALTGSDEVLRETRAIIGVDVLAAMLSDS